MREVSGIAVDHVVIQSSRSYEAVKTALEQRLGTLGWQLATKRASWDEIVRTIELQLGPCGFSIFGKVERGPATLLGRKARKDSSLRHRTPRGVAWALWQTCGEPSTCHMNSFRSSIAPRTSARYHPLRRQGLRRDALTVTRQSRLVFPLSEDHSCSEARFPMCRSRLSPLRNVGRAGRLRLHPG
jgi:hypothetical protein